MLHKVPTLASPTPRLSLAGNRLTSLDTRDLPASLEHLLLGDNMLEELTEENLAHLAR